MQTDFGAKSGIFDRADPIYLANPRFAAEYPEVLAAVVDELTKLTKWAARNRDKFSELTSTSTGVEPDAVRSAVGRTDLVVRPVTPTVIAQLYETADAFLKVGVISKPIVIHDAIWSPPAG